MLSKDQIEEVRKYIKKLKKEGSTTAGVPGYQTPKAFTGDEDGEGASDLARITRATGYDIKAKKTRNHSIDLHEVSYKEFKMDDTKSTVKKVNESIIEVNRKLREIDRLISHSTKLKNESNLDDSVLWKKTNEALIRIARRMSEVAKKTKQFANIKEIESAVSIDNQLKSILDAYKAAQGVKAKAVKHQDGIDIVNTENNDVLISLSYENGNLVDDNGYTINDLVALVNSNR